jgi:hypothetical protein
MSLSSYQWNSNHCQVCLWRCWCASTMLSFSFPWHELGPNDNPPLDIWVMTILQGMAEPEWPCGTKVLPPWALNLDYHRGGPPTRSTHAPSFWEHACWGLISKFFRNCSCPKRTASSTAPPPLWKMAHIQWLANARSKDLNLRHQFQYLSQDIRAPFGLG